MLPMEGGRHPSQETEWSCKRNLAQSQKDTVTVCPNYLQVVANLTADTLAEGMKPRSKVYGPLPVKAYSKGEKLQWYTYL